MKFTVGNYTTKWESLVVGLIGCAISPLLFIMFMELILNGAAYTAKRLMTKGKNGSSFFESVHR